MLKHTPSAADFGVALYVCSAEAAKNETHKVPCSNNYANMARQVKLHKAAEACPSPYSFRAPDVWKYTTPCLWGNPKLKGALFEASFQVKGATG